MNQLVIIRGYPGSGKTTLGKRLEDNGYGIFIDHNAILTFIAGIIGNDDGVYDEIHSLELSMARKLLAEGKSAIVARGFSGSTSADPYLRLAEKNQVKVVVIRLEVGIDTLEKRVIAPERKKDFNPTIEPYSLRAWIESSPLEAMSGEIIIDASEDINKVLERAEAVITS